MSSIEDKFGKIDNSRINHEVVRPTPVLVKNFDAIRVRPNIHPKPEDFSDNFSSLENRQHVFKESRKSFEFVFSKDKFVEHINKPFNKESFRYLKQVRRFGLILRAVYRFLDKKHTTVEKLQKFISLLGKYNDSYELLPPEDLKQELLDCLDGIEFPVDFVDTKEFHEYTRNLITETENLATKTVLPIEDFHTLRKRLRMLADLLQVSAAEDLGGNTHWLFHSIIDISSELGQEHDEIVQRSLTKKINYADQKIKLGPRIAPDFQKIKPYLQKICGLDISN